MANPFPITSETWPLDRPWLPQFQKLQASNEAWATGANGATAEDWINIKAGLPVRAAFTSKLARWMVQQLNEAKTDKSDKLELANDAKCCILSGSKCRAKGWCVDHGRYVRVVIGHDANGERVFEGAHRMVAWLKHGIQSGTDTAMHLGQNSGQGAPCKPWCVNHHHIEWGTPKNNTQDYHARKRRRGSHLNG